MKSPFECSSRLLGIPKVTISIIHMVISPCKSHYFSVNWKLEWPWVELYMVFFFQYRDYHHLTSSTVDQWNQKVWESVKSTEMTKRVVHTTSRWNDTMNKDTPVKIAFHYSPRVLFLLLTCKLPQQQAKDHSSYHCPPFGPESWLHNRTEPINNH